MISVNTAISSIIAHRGITKTVSAPLSEALGTRLAKNVTAKVTLPPRDASAMDGYAVRLADVRAKASTLRVIGEAPAGSPFKGKVNQGEAVRIFTGGAVPTTTDYETARHIRKAGIDFKTGDILIKADTRLAPAHIALAAAANHDALPIFKPPVVALIANGDELKPPGYEVEKGDIISSNAAGLGALILSWGGNVMDMGIASDSVESILALIKAAKEADIIVPIGGASVGDYDFMRTAFKEAGLNLVFEKIAVRPGKPTWFGTLGNQTVLGLPGNPASATVCAHLFLKILMHRADNISTQKAVLTQPLPANGPRETYLRGHLEVSDKGITQVMPFPRQDSSLLTPFARANILLRLHPDTGPWDKGDLVEI